VLPFGAAQFFGVFAAYNTAVWPLQLFLYAGAAACVALAASRHFLAGRAISVFLAALWAWMGVAYHFAFFSDINPAAWLFGTLFLAAAAAFAWHGVLHDRLRFDGNERPRRGLGIVLVATALVGYPLASSLAGHAYPATPTFGLPCPTTIFTLGMLQLAARPVPRTLQAIPIAWALLASTAVFQLGVTEDLFMLAAAVAVLGLPAFRPILDAGHPPAPRRRFNG
jgi:hypothetical protein